MAAENVNLVTQVVIKFCLWLYILSSFILNKFGGRFSNAKNVGFVHPVGMSLVSSRPILIISVVEVSPCGQPKYSLLRFDIIDC